MNPYLIEGPAVISFSGGRTSGYMLRQVLDVGLQPDVHVLFANTGVEREETLRFVHEIEMRWDVPVYWVQRRREGDITDIEEVTYHTAAREAEPFTQLITDRKCLPNPAQRWCTQELKLRPMRDWMRGRGHEHWDAAVGIRADEPRRIAKMREANEARSERWTTVLPLVEAGVTVADVMAFWKTQPFDLQLKPYEGNCTICFLKHVNKRERIAKDRPDLAVWWIEQERRTGQFFRQDEPDYATLSTLGNFFDGHEDEPDGIDCHCTD